MSYLGLGLLTVRAALGPLGTTPPGTTSSRCGRAMLAAEALAMAAIAVLLRRRGLWCRRPPARDGRTTSHLHLYFASRCCGLAEIRDSGCDWLGGLGGRAELVADDRALHSPALLAATVCITACYMLLAWQHRSPVRTWIGSMVALAGLVHAAV